DCSGPAVIVETGDRVDEVAIDANETGPPDIGDRVECPGAIVDASQEGEDVRLEALHPQAHPGAARFEPGSGASLVGARGVGLEGDLRVGSEGEARAHLVEHVPEETGIEP